MSSTIAKAVIIFAAACVGCSDPVDTSAARSASLNADGWFQISGSPPGGPGSMFMLHTADSTQTRSLYMWLSARTLPAAGRYEIGSLSGGYPEPDRFAATYSHNDRGTMRRYVAQQGFVNLTTSSPDRMTGVFNFRALLFCLSTEQPVTQSYSCRGSEVDPTAPVIDVSGSFTLMLNRDTVGLLLRQSAQAR